MRGRPPLRVIESFGASCHARAAGRSDGYSSARRLLVNPAEVGFHRFFEMTTATAEDFAGIVSQRVEAERHTLAGNWLRRLNEVLTIDANEVFPSEQLLDHIPDLDPGDRGVPAGSGDEEIAANTVVIEKARELGRLRHDQRASVHQLLREYEILAEILETFVVEETSGSGFSHPPRRMFRASPPADAFFADTDADDRRHVRQRIHDGD